MNKQILDDNEVRKITELYIREKLRTYGIDETMCNEIREFNNKEMKDFLQELIEQAFAAGFVNRGLL